MRKYIKYIIAVLILIIISTAAYLIVDSSKTKSENDDAAKGIVKLSEFNSDKIERVTIENESGIYEFVYKNGEWKWKDEKNAPFDLNSEMLMRITLRMSDLSSEKIIAENPDSISQYGLDNPIRISCYAQNNEHSIELGSMNPTATSYYIKQTDKKTVYTIDSNTAQSLLNDRDSLKDPNIFNASSMDVKNIRLIRDNELIFDVSKDENQLWLLNSPTKNLSPNLSKFSTYNSLLIRAMAYAYIEENPSDLSKYGLDDPKYIVEAETDDKKSRIIFGNEPADYPEAVYTMVENSKSRDVVVIYKSNLGFLDVSTADIISEYIYNISVSNVSEVNISLDGQTAALGIDYAENEYSFNGVKISDEGRLKLYNEFYESFNMMKISDTEISAEPDMSGEPQIEIAYTLNDGTRLSSAYYSKEGTDMYYLAVDGEYTGALVSQNSIMSVKGAYAGILNRVSEEPEETE